MVLTVTGFSIHGLLKLSQGDVAFSQADLFEMSVNEMFVEIPIVGLPSAELLFRDLCFFQRSQNRILKVYIVNMYSTRKILSLM